MPGPIDESLLMTAMLETRQQIDFLWQFFVSVQIAVFALFLIYDEAVENLSLIARFLAFAGIALFDWINGNALAGAYRFLDATLDQYRFLYGQAERFRPAFHEHVVLASYADRPDLVKITHGTALLVVFLALVSQSFIVSRPRRGT